MEEIRKQDCGAELMVQADNGERRITFADLLRFRSNGLIGAARFGAAAFAVRDHDHAARIVNGALLALGAFYLAAGFLFFGAHIWDNLPNWQKFAMIEAAIAVLVIASLCAGLTKPAGQVLLIAATLTTGLLLHAVEWIYPTSAGRLEIHLVWSLIILPWVMASRSAAHWIVWTVIALAAVHATLIFYLEPAGLLAPAYRPFGLAMVPAVVLIAGEAMRWRSGFWLRATWPRYVLLVLAFGLLLDALAGQYFPARTLFGTGGSGAASGLASPTVFGFAALAAIWFYRFRARDYAAFAIAVAFAVLAIILAGARIIDLRLGLSPGGVTELLGWVAIFVLVGFCVGAMALLLRHQARTFGVTGHAD